MEPVLLYAQYGVYEDDSKTGRKIFEQRQQCLKREHTHLYVQIIGLFPIFIWVFFTLSGLSLKVGNKGKKHLPVSDGYNTTLTLKYKM